MGSDYIPTRDTEFLAWAQNFVNYVNTHEAELGIEPDQTVNLTPRLTAFSATMSANTAAADAARGAKQDKDIAREQLEDTVRVLVRQLQASPMVDDGERAAMGITVKDAIRTMAAAAATRPVGMADTSQRLRHEISFFDEATPTRRAKPEGASGCEIWVKLNGPGEPAPADPKEFSFVALDTASPYVLDFDGADASKTAHYILRWVLKGGAKGPWSETVSATIVA